MRLLDRIARDQKSPLDSFRIDPSLLPRLAGILLDDWQSGVVASTAARTALLCSRQVGKSTVAAIVALRTALLEAPALVLVVAPSERQSAELIRKIKGFYEAVKRPRRLAGPVRRLAEVSAAEAALDEAWRALPDKERESALQLHLKNGSRIIGLPAQASTVVGFSGVSLLIVDEAARVPDELYRFTRPMLATSHGRLLVCSTPLGKRGFFHESWESREAWHRVRVTAEQCSRIPADFLADERLALGERWYRQEYFCSFEDTVGAVFAEADIHAACAGTAAPLTGF